MSDLARCSKFLNCYWLLAVLAFCWPGGAAYAQTARGKAPPPVDVNLTTKDGVRLRATYYPSNAGQKAVPVVMLHDLHETRAVFAPLAQALQNPPRAEDDRSARWSSFAVIAVDLRGHGGSKTAYNADGSSVELDSNRFRQRDFQAMVDYDMETVRRFLVEQNDLGKLNLNSLGIVGCGMGANVAVLWSAKDWATPSLARRKQGQDVKALALLSPRWNFNGLLLRDAMKFPPVQQRLSVLLAYGADDRNVARDCQNLEAIWTKYHPEPSPDQASQFKDLFIDAPDTNLQGAKLLTSRAFGVGSQIAEFLETRLTRRDFPYSSRKGN